MSYITPPKSFADYVYDPALGTWNLKPEATMERYIFSDLPKGNQVEIAKENSSELKKECWNWNHEYINVGFHHDKLVCKKCDKEKV